MLDLTKPVQTRDGRKVRILCTDRKHTNKEYGPVVGLITQKDGNETYQSWFLDGRLYGDQGADRGRKTDQDLVNSPTVHTRWVVFYTSPAFSGIRDELYRSKPNTSLWSEDINVLSVQEITYTEEQ